MLQVFQVYTVLSYLDECLIRFSTRFVALCTHKSRKKVLRPVPGSTEISAKTNTKVPGDFTAPLQHVPVSA